MWNLFCWSGIPQIVFCLFLRQVETNRSGKVPFYLSMTEQNCVIVWTLMLFCQVDIKNMEFKTWVESRLYPKITMCKSEERQQKIMNKTTLNRGNHSIEIKIDLSVFERSRNMSKWKSCFYYFLVFYYI